MQAAVVVQRAQLGGPPQQGLEGFGINIGEGQKVARWHWIPLSDSGERRRRIGEGFRGLLDQWRQGIDQPVGLLVSEGQWWQ